MFGIVYPEGSIRFIEKVRTVSVFLSGLSAAAIAAAELIIICLAILTVFRRWGYTFAEACAFAIVTAWMLLSCLFQLAFMTGYPALAVIAEILACILAIAAIIRNAAVLSDDLSAFPQFFRAYPIGGPIAAIAWCYLGLQAFFIPQHPSHWHDLSQILLFEQQGSFFNLSNPDLPSGSIAALSPANITILAHLFLRGHTDFGIGLIGFTAYMSIGFSTYALSRRYAWPPTAFTVTILVLSMPRLIYHSTTPGIELVPAATGLFCLLAVYRAIESPNVKDICLLSLGLLFMFSGTAITLIFPILLIPLSGLLLFRRHGFSIWWRLLVENRRTVLAALVPALVFSQIWLIIYNLYCCAVWLGNPSVSPVALNTDGIQGALANFLRYLLESAHFTQIVDNVCRWVAGFSISELWQSFYNATVTPMLGNRGSVAPFQIVWNPDEHLAWFGPFGFLLVLPAVVNAALRAPRRLKAIAVALIGYFFLISLILAWSPGNARYFTIFFVCSGYCVAFLLPPWRISRRTRRGLQIAGAVLLLYTGLYNSIKPAIGIKTHPASLKTGIQAQESTESVWYRSRWGFERFYPARQIFGDDRLAKIAALVPDGESLQLIYTSRSNLYPFLLMFPAANTCAAQTCRFDNFEQHTDTRAKYLLWVDTEPTGQIPGGVNILWQSESKAGSPGGAIWQLYDNR